MAGQNQRNGADQGVISGQSGPDSDRAELVMEQLERSLMLLEEDYRQTIQVGRVGTEAAEGGGCREQFR